MTSPRRPRRRPGAPEPDPFNPVQWPELKAQQALQAALDPAEAALARQRCRTLVEAGYGALLPWLASDPTPAESRRGQAPPRASSQGSSVLDLFD